MGVLCAARSSTDTRVRPGLVELGQWWAMQDSNLRLLPCESDTIWFYNNLQDRGDCQSSRKSYKTSETVGWVVG